MLKRDKKGWQISIGFVPDWARIRGKRFRFAIIKMKRIPHMSEMIGKDDYYGVIWESPAFFHPLTFIRMWLENHNY